MADVPSPDELLRRKRKFLDAAQTGSDIWIFGYGSLMWNPGFAYVEKRPALLHGWHRAFCVYSWRHRGTPEKPGLVLGLDRGGSCRGLAYRVAAARLREVLDYLWDREMVNGVYQPRILHPRAGTDRIPCHAFTVDREHQQYARGLAQEEMARLIRQGVGQSGANRDYLAGLVGHLDELGISDGPLHRLLAAVARG